MANIYYESGSDLIGIDLDTLEVNLFYNLNDYILKLANFTRWEEKGILTEDDTALSIKYRQKKDVDLEVLKENNNVFALEDGHRLAYPIILPYNHKSWYLSGKLSILKSSKNKEEALDFLDLIQKDKKLSNAIRNGNSEIDVSGSRNYTINLLLDERLYKKNQTLKSSGKKSSKK